MERNAGAAEIDLTDDEYAALAGAVTGLRAEELTSMADTAAGE